MGLKNILYKVQNGIAEVILNRAEKMNSLDEEMIDELHGLMVDFSVNRDVKIITISGAGENFCSGLYLDYLRKISEYDIIQNKRDSRKFKEMLLSIYNNPKPVIAKVQGYCLAGGCGIASACDVIVADESAKFGYTEVKIGFIPAIVMLFLLKRVSETHARELLLTARLISSHEALGMGLINYSVKSDELDSKLSEICSMIMKNSQSSIMLTKEMFANISGMDFEKALEYACDVNAITRMTEDCRQGISRFLSGKR